MQSQTRKNWLFWYKFIDYTVANELLLATRMELIFDNPDNLSLTALKATTLCRSPKLLRIWQVLTKFYLQWKTNRNGKGGDSNYNIFWLRKRNWPLQLDESFESGRNESRRLKS